MTGYVEDLVVCLHGRGLGPDSAAVVAPAFPGARVLAPDGGVALRRGWTWFENKRIGVAQANSVATAEARFLAWCEDGLLSGRAARLCGFNGGALVAHLLMRHPDCFRGAALLSAPPVLYVHGDAADTVVSSALSALAEAYLAGAPGRSLSSGTFRSGTR